MSNSHSLEVRVVAVRTMKNCIGKKDCDNCPARTPAPKGENGGGICDCSCHKKDNPKVKSERFLKTLQDIREQQAAVRQREELLPPSRGKKQQLYGRKDERKLPEIFFAPRPHEQ